MTPQQSIAHISRLLDNCYRLSQCYSIIEMIRNHCNKHGNSKETQELYLRAHNRSNEIINTL